MDLSDMKKEDYRAPNDVQKKIETWWTTKRDSDLAARMGKGPKFWKFSEGTLKIVGSGDFDGCSGIAIVSPHGALVGHFWPQNNTGAPLKIKDFEAQYNNHKSDLAGANVYVFAKEKDDPQDKNIWQEEHFVKFLKEELQTAEPKAALEAADIEYRQACATIYIDFDGEKVTTYMNGEKQQ
ncbi:MAG: hypothetical protein MMC23_002317 [Stictis urceolatum]|nr:hypothetical protein [Stictis urceolata]